MKVQNELAAKILGEIISEGMSISEIDLSKRVRDEAVTALGEIKLVMYKSDKNDREKIGSIERIMQKYNIGK